MTDLQKLDCTSQVVVRFNIKHSELEEAYKDPLVDTLRIYELEKAISNKIKDRLKGQIQKLLVSDITVEFT